MPILCPQPERKNDTSMEVLARFFHLPINEASKALGICSTSLKKICRKHGLVRWPHRKVITEFVIGRASYRKHAIGYWWENIKNYALCINAEFRLKAWRTRWWKLDAYLVSEGCTMCVYMKYMNKPAFLDSEANCNSSGFLNLGLLLGCGVLCLWQRYRLKCPFVDFLSWLTSCYL